MKIVKLKLTNFLPYYGEANEIVLFDNERPDKNVTLNIGQTGYGKTSISEAVMWCLFGETYIPRWEPMVNDLAIEIAKQTPQKMVKIAVEMEVEIEGETYLILRSGNYDYKEKIREDNTKVSVRTNGETKKEPVNFINENFLPINLMDYFIFDADDMLKLFDSNQEKTIKDLINKIVGVETLDDMSETLKNVEQIFLDDINEIKLRSSGDSEIALKRENEKKNIKEEAIKNINRDIEELENKKKELIPKGRLTHEDIKLKEVMDNVIQAKEDIKICNKQFEDDSTLISNFYLLFLNEIIEKSIESLRIKDTTKVEFDSAIDVLKSTLKGKYAGVLIDEEQTMLLRRGINIRDGELENLGEITLEEGSGIKVQALQELNLYGNPLQNVSKDFNKQYSNYTGAISKLTQARNLLKQIGETEKNKKRKENIDEFLGVDQKIKELRSIIEETETELAKIDKIIDDLNREVEIDKEDRKMIEKTGKNIEKIVNMTKIVDISKKLFLNGLLKEVNDDASEFFRKVRRRDESRLHSIVVDSDYKLIVKNENNETIETNTINKGNMQIALMAFFFGLSKFLKYKLPYVIDDPSIRLDPGHDKRLLQHLCNSEQQIIMHMIPGREYTKDSYEWLKPYLNTQNWINRKRETKRRFNKMTSSVDVMNPNKFVEFDIDKF